MTPADCLTLIVNPCLAWLARRAERPLATPEAAVMLLAIGLHESGLTERWQRGDGPGRGLWQFEAPGVSAVLGHPAAAWLAPALEALGYHPTRLTVHRALADNDLVACALARALLWTDPAPLPALGDQVAAYRYYDRLWRPGAKRPAAWPDSYQRALRTGRQSWSPGAHLEAAADALARARARLADALPEADGLPPVPLPAHLERQP